MILPSEENLLNRSGDLTGAHTPGTNIHMAGAAIDDRLDPLHIGLPSTVGAPVRVRDLDAKGNALIAELAFSHPLHLPAAVYSCPFAGTFSIITELIEKSKKIFQKRKSFL